MSVYVSVHVIPHVALTVFIKQQSSEAQHQQIQRACFQPEPFKYASCCKEAFHAKHSKMTDQLYHV